MTRLKHRESKKVCIEIRGAYCMGKLGIRVGKSNDLRLSILPVIRGDAIVLPFQVLAGLPPTKSDLIFFN